MRVVLIFSVASGCFLSSFVAGFEASFLLQTHSSQRAIVGGMHCAPDQFNCGLLCVERAHNTREEMFCDSFKILETGSGDSMTPAEKGIQKKGVVVVQRELQSRAAASTEWRSPSRCTMLVSVTSMCRCSGLLGIRHRRFKLFISRMLHRNIRLTAAAISAPADGSADFACQALINRRPGDNLHLQIPLTIGVFQILM
jgi:hypothetical protein